MQMWVLDNYRPGVMKNSGIDYDTVSNTNPGVIYLSITGTGPTGLMCDPRTTPLARDWEAC